MAGTKNTLTFKQKLQIIELLKVKTTHESMQSCADWVQEKLGIPVTAVNIRSLADEDIVPDLKFLSARGQAGIRDAELEKLRERVRDAESRLSNIEKQLGITPPPMSGT